MLEVPNSAKNRLLISGKLFESGGVRGSLLQGFLASVEFLVLLVHPGRHQMSLKTHCDGNWIAWKHSIDHVCVSNRRLRVRWVRCDLRIAGTRLRPK